MTRVKICGVTCEEDARAAIALGVHALGFNTWRGSKRFLDLEAAAPWLERLPPFVGRVALTVNAPLAEARRLARLPFIDAVQVHGDEDSEYCAALAEAGRPVIKALRVRELADLEAGAGYRTAWLLLDALVPGSYGGTGSVVDPALAREFHRRFPQHELLLAGGLRPENVAEAIRAARPFAVDVSSGVESSPGRKDGALMAAFMQAVASA